MVTHSVDTIKEEISPEVELLNLACLDLVAQIEQLKEENARLKKRLKRKEGQVGGQDWSPR